MAKYIIDTNVPMQAAKDPSNMNEIEALCSERCLNFIQSFINDPTSKLVLDDCWEIFNEYRKNIPQNAAPSIATIFMKWVCKRINEISVEDYLHLAKDCNGLYKDFPSHNGLKNFDNADRKFIALANTHPEHPAIIQGTDYKWHNFEKIFSDFGIVIFFLCDEYIQYRLKTRK